MKILFTGSHSVGKDSVIKKFLHDNKNYVTNTGLIRSFNLPFFKVYKEADDISQLIIANSMFNFLFENFDKNIIFNRFLIDCLAYTHYAYSVTGLVSEHTFNYIKGLYDDYMKYIDIVFYIPIEFEIKKDNFRDHDETYQKYIDHMIKYYLDTSKIKYVTLIGSIESRYNIVKENLKGIKEFRK